MRLPEVPAPWPLVVAGALAFLEGLALVVYGVLQLFTVTTERLVLVTTNTAFFVVYGGALAVFAWLLVTRLRAWTRAPLALAQLIQLGVAWNFRGGGTGGVAAVLLVVAAVVLAGVFHPRSRAAVEASAGRED